ncbi:MAG: error-prone DNA polymerase [Pseudohongiellaceae bacterium]|nr:error-prone DNA polymerase [Pseudohongiellaceae bacterium]
MSCIAYAELHCLSNYSFLRCASFPEEMVLRAAELEYSALAITDECSLSGVVRAHMAAKDAGLKLLIGSSFVSSEGLHFVLLARNRRGYAQLSHLITLARRRAAKGSYHLDRSLLAEQCLEDCLGICLPAAKPVNDAALFLSECLPGRLWIGVELWLRGDDRSRLKRLMHMSEELRLPLVACGGVVMHVPERRALWDTLTAIRLGRRVDELAGDAACNGEQHLRSRERLAKLYPPALLEQSTYIASLCDFSLDELRYEYPQELVPKGHTPTTWLREITFQGMQCRWPEGVPKKIVKLVERELALVAELAYEQFFLTVHDLLVFARSQNILCQGRGSAANSAICYCLGITELNPDSMDLLFERFLSKERDEPPDIDVDFEHERREEVIQYIFNKYGRHRAALAATVICYRTRSAVRDVGKALGYSEDAINALSKKLNWKECDMGSMSYEGGDANEQRRLKLFTELVQQLIGFPRHLSQHVGGFVISQGSLSELVPIENASMEDRTVIQWEKDDLEALGLLKVDVLALGMLTAIRKSFDLLNELSGQNITMASIPADDTDVYNMISAADTVGVFQIESRAQMSMLPRLKPRNYYDLVIQIAIVRPGPIQGDMVHPYLARRSGKQAVDYPSNEIKKVLQRTLGVPIFQEQVMKIAIVAAGFTGGEADQLRRAMAAWKKKGGLEPFRDKLVKGMLARGYKEEFALQIYSQIKGFGDYGFPESHSASFALLAYVSSWLKFHHPAAFCAALLNSQPMGFYGPSQLIQDVQRHGVTVYPVSVNDSDWDCVLLPEEGGPAIRLGLRMVKGLSYAGACRVIEARKTGPYQDVEDLISRSGIHGGDSESLAAADALAALARDRHRAFWSVAGYRESLPLFAQGGSRGEWPEPSSVDVLLPRPSEAENIVADYNSTGLTLRRHPLALLRQHFDGYQVCTAAVLPELTDGVYVKVVGIVTARQRPQTAAGVTFMTIEDETGFSNVVVWSTIVDHYREAVHEARLLGVSGRLQIADGVVHVLAQGLVDLSDMLSDMVLKSRDFC